METKNSNPSGKLPCIGAVRMVSWEHEKYWKKCLIVGQIRGFAIFATCEDMADNDGMGTLYRDDNPQRFRLESDHIRIEREEAIILMGNLVGFHSPYAVDIYEKLYDFKYRQQE